MAALDDPFQTSPLDPPFIDAVNRRKNTITITHRLSYYFYRPPIIIKSILKKSEKNQKKSENNKKSQKISKIFLKFTWKRK